MAKEKEFMPIDERLNLLESKGLKITSKKRALNYINNIGYYKLLNGYRLPYINKQKNVNSEEIVKVYNEGTTIDDIYYLYKFDQELKVLIFKYATEIETKVKGAMSEVISERFGVKESQYLVASNFKPDSQSKDENKQKIINFTDMQTTILTSIKEQKSKNKIMKWYCEQHGYYPFWALANVLPFGTISLLYSKLKQPEQFEISKYFNLKSKIFESILAVLHLFRNACAHNEVIYNFRTKRSISSKEIKHLFEYYQFQKDSKNNRYIKGTNDIFAILIIFKLCLDATSFNEFFNAFNSIKNTLKKKVNENIYKEILLEMAVPEDLAYLKTLKI